MPVVTASTSAQTFAFLASAEDIYLRFRGGDERYAVPVPDASEIFEVESLRRVPGSFFPVAGVVDLRGRIVTLLDLFGAATAGAQLQALVFHEPFRHVGLLVPSLPDTFTMADGDETRPVEEGLRERRPWVSRMLQHGGRLYSVLSGERLCAYARARLIETYKR
jgi:chemotaxis signal transduction protein